MDEDTLVYNLRIEMRNAEAKAWKALAGYKFWMFGYWAAVWVHYNRVGRFREPNPFAALVKFARGYSKEGR